MTRFDLSWRPRGRSKGDPSSSSSSSATSSSSSSSSSRSSNKRKHDRVLFQDPILGRQFEGSHRQDDDEYRGRKSSIDKQGRGSIETNGRISTDTAERRRTFPDSALSPHYDEGNEGYLRNPRAAAQNNFASLHSLPNDDTSQRIPKKGILKSKSNLNDPIGLETQTPFQTAIEFEPQFQTVTTISFSDGIHTMQDAGDRNRTLGKESHILYDVLRNPIAQEDISCSEGKHMMQKPEDMHFGAPASSRGQSVAAEFSENPVGILQHNPGLSPRSPVHGAYQPPGGLPKTKSEDDPIVYQSVLLAAMKSEDAQDPGSVVTVSLDKIEFDLEKTAEEDDSPVVVTKDDSTMPWSNVSIKSIPGDIAEKDVALKDAIPDKVPFGSQMLAVSAPPVAHGESNEASRRRTSVGQEDHDGSLPKGLRFIENERREPDVFLTELQKGIRGAKVAGANRHVEKHFTHGGSTMRKAGSAIYRSNSVANTLNDENATQMKALFDANKTNASKMARATVKLLAAAQENEDLMASAGQRKSDKGLKKKKLDKQFQKGVPASNRVGEKITADTDDQISMVCFSVQRGLGMIKDAPIGRAVVGDGEGAFDFKASVKPNSHIRKIPSTLGKITSDRPGQDDYFNIKSRKSYAELQSDFKKNFGTEDFLKLEDECPSGSKMTYVKAADDEDAFDVEQPAFTLESVQDASFQSVRAAFDIPEDEYYENMALPPGEVMSSFYFISQAAASGKSASFFIVSPNQKFILKSCIGSDVEVLCKILPHYVQHCKKYGNKSLLPRYLGLYTLRYRATRTNKKTLHKSDKKLEPITLLCMTNFFAGMYEIHEKYDLKGSSHARHASKLELRKKRPVFKDLDWVSKGRKLAFPKEEQLQKVLHHLELDAGWLAENGLIDYSLLVGVHHVDKKDPEIYEGYEPSNVIICRSDDFLSYIGIVDILTKYNCKKFAETFCCGTLLACRDISCQPPEKYAARFVKFMKAAAEISTLTIMPSGEASGEASPEDNHDDHNRDDE